MSEQADPHIRAFMDHQTALGSRYRRALARRLGLEPYEMAAVLHLARSELTAGQLSLQLVLSIDEVTLLISRLEDAGHVVRRPHAEDPQLVAVAVSEATLGWLADVTKPLIDEVDALTSALEPRERETIGRFMEAAAVISEREADNVARAALEGRRESAPGDGR